MEYTYHYDNTDYRSAVNYDNTNYHNIPITIEVNGVLYILPFGTRDKKHVHIEGKDLLILGENSGLSYASLVVIDTTENSDKGITTAHADQLDDEFFELDLLGQIRYMSDYLPY